MFLYNKKIIIINYYSLCWRIWLFNTKQSDPACFIGEVKLKFNTVYAIHAYTVYT